MPNAAKPAMKNAPAQVKNTSVCPGMKLVLYAKMNGINLELKAAPKLPHMLAQPKIAPVFLPPISCIKAQIDGFPTSVIIETTAQQATTPQAESIRKHNK